MKMLVTTLDYKCVLASVFTYSYKMIHLCYFEVLPRYVRFGAEQHCSCSETRHDSHAPVGPPP